MFCSILAARNFEKANNCVDALAQYKIAFSLFQQDEKLKGKIEKLTEACQPKKKQQEKPTKQKQVQQQPQQEESPANSTSDNTIIAAPDACGFVFDGKRNRVALPYSAAKRFALPKFNFC